MTDSGSRFVAIRVCPLCRNDSFVPYGLRGDGVELRACSTCGLVSVATTFADPDELYDRAYFGQDAKPDERAGVGYPEYAQPLHESLWNLGFAGIAAVLADAPADRLLDVGCATGDFLYVAHLWGWPGGSGVELSEYAADVARSVGLAVRTGKLDAVPPTERFAIVTAWELIEHLVDVDEFIDQVNDRLTPDGVFLVSTPNAGSDRALVPDRSWAGYQGSYEHISYFSKDTLARALERCGGEVFFFEHDVHGVENLVAINFRRPLAPAAGEFLRQIYANPEQCATDVMRGTIDKRIAPYLAFVYAESGHLAQATELAEWLVAEGGPRLRHHQFLAGWVALQAGNTQRALEMLQQAGKSPELRSLVDSTTVTAHIRSTQQIMLAFEHQVAQVSQKQEAVATLTSERDQLAANLQQMATDREEQIALRGAMINSRDQQLSDRDSSITERDQQLLERDAAITERDQAITQRDVQIATLADRLVQLEGELATAHDLVHDVRTRQTQLEGRLEEREGVLARVVVTLSERDRMLDEIMSGTGWILLRVLWDWRTRLVPHGSARDRALWLLLTSYRTFKTTGPGGLVGLASRGAQHALLSAVRSGVVSILPPRLAAVANSRMPTSTATPTVNPVQPARDDVAEVSRILEQAPPAPVLTIPSSPLPGRYDVIVLPIIDWNFRFQRPQQIATRFAATGHRVFYVASTFRDGPGPLLRPVHQGVVEVQLPGPTGLSIYANTLEQPLLASVITVMAALRAQFQIHDAVCIVDLPFWTPLAERLRTLFGWKLIYDCLDDYGGFSNISERMLSAEAGLTESSDLVLATSRHLLAKQRERNPATIFVPNAAHFQHFRFGSNLPPPDIESLAHPIVGYYGAISEWFDTQLVGYLARARPDWEFVLVGSTAGAQLEPLRGLSNVHLLGEKPYRTLPGYLHAFDVCIIPFRRTPLTDATNPVKLFEYLSAGKQIVATQLSELAYYRDYVQLVSDRAEWLQALDAALAAPTAERELLRRVDFARANDWDDRIQVIQHHVAGLFPLVSIIIVTYNNLDYTRLCLDSIYAKTTYPSFEVVVVDNASSDGTQDYLRQFAARHPNFKFLLNENNEGFARANNLGVEVASGEYVLFLNNDTIVTPGWLSRLIYYLRDPEIGMVGPVTNSSGNESRINVEYRAIDEIDAFAESYTRAHDGQSFDIRMLALFCVAVRRATIEAVGNLDERFGIGTFEDDDYSMRIRALSLRIVCAEDVYIHHWGGASFSRLNRDDYQRIFTENRQKFEEKWGIDWEPHRYRTAL